METKSKVKASTLAKKIARACYPSYKGRTIAVESKETYYMADFWDGGSRAYCIGYNLETRQILPHVLNASVPWNDLAHRSFTIPAGIAIVEHTFFCGKDMGIRIYVNPAADKAGLISEVK